MVLLSLAVSPLLFSAIHDSDFLSIVSTETEELSVRTVVRTLIGFFGISDFFGKNIGIIIIARLTEAMDHGVHRGD